MRRILGLLILLFAVFSANAQDKLRFSTVVIDPGHGGKDPGCISRDRSTQEKNLTLDIAERLSARISAGCPEVKVVMTRNSDEFISLNDRAEIANKNGANLFISIHINASRKSDPCGFSVHVLGDSRQKDRDLFEMNMDVVKRENAVIFLEDDYNTKYQGFNPDDPRTYIFMTLMQGANREQSLNFAQIIADDLSEGPFDTNRGICQDPFFVLWKTSMPAVLVELGFMSNYNDIRILRKEESRDKIADALYNAFVEYKISYNKSVGASDTVEQPKASDVDVVVEEEKIVKILPSK